MAIMVYLNSVLFVQNLLFLAYSQTCTGACEECAPGCSSTLLENSVCDVPCNSAACGWDNSKCRMDFTCSKVCDVAQVTPTQLGNGKCDLECNVKACGFDSKNGVNDCFENCKHSGCDVARLGDGACDEQCRSQACGFDMGDCGFCSYGCTEAMLRNPRCDLPCNVEKCGFDEQKCTECAPGCLTQQQGDGECQSACNVKSCQFDKGDCGRCNEGCSLAQIGDGTCDIACYTSLCNFDSSDCETASVGDCSLTSIGNGSCEAQCNTAAANWDGGDCDCAAGCTHSLRFNSECDAVCNVEACNWDNSVCVGARQGFCSPGCTEAMLGDGRCDPQCQTVQCLFDRGDCKCNDGCVVTDFGSCPARCLNYACGYAGYGRTGGCSNTFTISTALATQAMKKDFFAVMDWAACSSADPSCTQSQLNYVWTTRLCYSLPFYSPICPQKACLYALGLCTSGKDASCIRGFGTTKNDCFQCQSPYVRLHSSCISKCPRRYQLDPAVPRLCTPGKDDSSLGKPDSLYVLESRVEGQGTLSSPYGSLGLALAAFWKGFSIIYLLGDSVSLSVNLSSTNPELMSLTSIYDPLGPSNSKRLVIKSLTCEEQWSDYCSFLFTEVDIVMPIYFTVRFPVIFERVVFTSKALFAGLPVQFCPQLKLTNGVWFDAYGAEASASLVQAAGVCSAFSEYSLFVVQKGGQLSLTVTLTQKVTVRNLTLQPKALIDIQGGNLVLEDVDFANFHTQRKKGTYGVIVQSKVCDGSDCGTISFHRGSVKYLNNGVEYVSGTVLSPFLNALYLQTLEFVEVAFAFNFIVEAFASALVPSDSALLSLGNFYQLTFTNCEFRSNVVTGGLIVVNSHVTLPKSTEVGKSEAYWYTRSHLVFSTVTFSKNLGGYSLVAMKFFSDVLNIDISQLNFTDNALAGKYVMTLSSASPATEALAAGSFQAVLVDGRQELLWVGPRHCTLSDLTIAHTHAFESLLFIANLANLRLSTVRITDVGHASTAVLTSLFSEYLHAAGVNAKLPVSLQAETQCVAFISCEQCFNVTATSLQVARGRCNAGSCGLRVLENKGSTSVTDYLSEENNCTSKDALALIANSIQVKNLVVRSNLNAQGPMLTFGMKAAVLLTDSSLRDNIGAGLTLNACESFTALRVTYRNNRAELGAAVNWQLNSTFLATATLEDCVFDGNAAINGGALAFEVTGTTTATVNLSLRSCKFAQNTASLYGPAIYVGLLVVFGEQSTVSWSLFQGHTNNYGVLYIKQQSRPLNFSDCVFEDNQGTIAAAMLLENDAGTVTVLERVQFRRNRRAPAILKLNSRVNFTLETHSCTFTESEGIVLEGGTWVDENSTFAFSSQSHVTLSSAAVASLSASRFLHSSGSSNGGAVHLMTGSSLSCTGCVFKNNSVSDQGGAVFSEQNSTVLLVGCLFVNNTAAFGGAALYLTSSREKTSAISSSLLEGNNGGRYGFIQVQTAVLVLRNVTARYNTGTEHPGIVLLISTLSIQNSRFAFMQGYMTTFLALLMSSAASIEDSEFADSASVTGGLLQLSSTSNLTARRSSFQRLSGHAVIAAASESIVALEEVIISNSTADAGLLLLSESVLSVRKSTLREFSQGGVSANSMTKVEITESHFVQGQGSEGTAGRFFQCSEVIISHCTFTGLKASGRGGALLFEALGFIPHSPIVIEDCNFADNSAPQGGAVSVNNQKVQFLHVSFSSNTAEVGGAVALTCSVLKMCACSATDCMFEDNFAVVKGGALSWEVAKPALANCTFLNNSAQYGHDIASFPVSLRVEALRPFAESRRERRTMALAPGQAATFAIIASLRDHYGEVISIDNSSVANIESTEAAVAGSTKVTAQRGQFTFDDFLVYGRPNHTISLTVTSTAIEPGQEGDPDPHTQSTELAFELRDCVPGEERSTESCVVCSPGTYSLDPSIPCKTCPSNAQCLGGMQVLPNSGYWRSSEYSPEVRECPNPAACLGGANATLTGRCAAPFKGNLCQSCAADYSRSTKNKCDKCPNQDSNVVRLAFIAVAMVVVISVMVWSTMRSATRPAATHSIMIRIFVNYTQLVLLVTEFKLSWPDPVLELFDKQETVGGATEQAYSIDCFLGDQSSDIYYRKMISMAILPVPLIVAAGLFWLAIATWKRNYKVLKRECAATIIILFFLILPNLVKALFSMFSCTEIEQGEYWLTVDMDIKCWNAKHTFHVLVVALPAIIVWIFAAPLACLAVLVKYHARLDELWLKEQFGFLINGYRRRCYYWEFVILYRKILIICCAVFLNNVIPAQALTVQFLLLLALFLQYNTLPYVTQQLNSLELLAIATADITIYSGLYYLTDDLSTEGSWFLFIAIITINLLFVIYWLLCLFGYFINVASSKFSIIGQVLKPGVFVDEYIEEFVAQCPRRPEAEAVAEMELQECYKKMKVQDISDCMPGQYRYLPRNNPQPTMTQGI